jgi:hypothetical protein
MAGSEGAFDSDGFALAGGSLGNAGVSLAVALAEGSAVAGEADGEVVPEQARTMTLRDAAMRRGRMSAIVGQSL